MYNVDVEWIEKNDVHTQNKRHHNYRSILRAPQITILPPWLLIKLSAFGKAPPKTTCGHVSMHCRSGLPYIHTTGDIISSQQLLLLAKLPSRNDGRLFLDSSLGLRADQRGVAPSQSMLFVLCYAFVPIYNLLPLLGSPALLHRPPRVIVCRFGNRVHPASANIATQLQGALDCTDPSESAAKQASKRK